MEQSIFMIPMYNQASGVHRAVARVRIFEGSAQVETRWSGFGEAEEIFILTDKSVHAVRDGRVSLSSGETLIGLASMNELGVCGCAGAVRGQEEAFERALVSLRIERQAVKPSKWEAEVLTRHDSNIKTEHPEIRPSETLLSTMSVSVENTLSAVPEIVEDAIVNMPGIVNDSVLDMPEMARNTPNTMPEASKEAEAIENIMFANSVERTEAEPTMLFSRAMDGYISPPDERIGVETAIFPEPEELFAIDDDPIKIFIPSSAASAMGIGEQTKDVRAYPYVSGEEPGWPVSSRPIMETTERAGETDVSFNGIHSDVADEGWIPANAPEEWSITRNNLTADTAATSNTAITGDTAIAMETSELPISSDALNETLLRAQSLFPPNDDRELPDTDNPESYPFVMPQRVNNPFPKQFPGSSWMRIQRLPGQGYYLEGRMRRGNENINITAAPGEYSPVPPRHLQGFTRYIQTKDGGFWVRVKKE